MTIQRIPMGNWDYHIAKSYMYETEDQKKELHKKANSEAFNTALVYREYGFSLKIDEEAKTISIRYRRS